MTYYIVKVKVIQYHYEIYKIDAEDEQDASGHWDIDGVKTNEETGGQNFEVISVKSEE